MTLTEKWNALLCGVVASVLGLIITTPLWAPVPPTEPDPRDLVQEEPPAAAVCGGKDGLPCGCGAEHCYEPCAACCPVVPCPIDNPTAGYHR